MGTTPKTIRLRDEDIAVMQALLPHFPEVRSDADLLYNAVLLGLWVLATAARRPGLETFGGYDPADLVALLRPRLLPALDFLAEQGALPDRVRAGAVVVEQERPAASGGDGHALPLARFDPEGAASLADMGADFME